MAWSANLSYLMGMVLRDRVGYGHPTSQNITLETFFSLQFTNEGKQDQDGLTQPSLLGRQVDKVYSLVWVVCLIVWTILVKVAEPYDITFPCLFQPLRFS